MIDNSVTLIFLKKPLVEIGNRAGLTTLIGNESRIKNPANGSKTQNWRERNIIKSVPIHLFRKWFDFNFLGEKNDEMHATWYYCSRTYFSSCKFKPSVSPCKLQACNFNIWIKSKSENSVFIEVKFIPKRVRGFETYWT